MTRRKLLLVGIMAADLAALAGSFYLTALWTDPVRWLDLEEMFSIRFRLRDLAMVAIVPLIWLAVFHRFRLYRERYMFFLKLRPYHLRDLVQAVSFCTLLLIGAAVFADMVHHVTAEIVIVFWATNTLATLLVRETVIRSLRQMRLHGRNLRHLLIVGTNKRARAFGQMIREQPELGYSLRGFVDDRWEGNPEDGERVASMETIGEYLKNHVVDEVLIALPVATLYEQASRVVKICENHGVVVQFVPGFDFLNAGSARATFDTVEDEPVITLLPPPMDGWQLGLKRLIDIVGAAICLVIFSPVFVIAALAIKLASEGPVLFIQDRVGLNKRTFRMFKFRTMIQRAEDLRKSLEYLNEASGPVFKIEKDPRVTPVGRFLRRTSLDELPQLINVLRGDMSLVGPRPLPLCDYAGFDQDWHRRRFSVRPGITCLWQVRGRSMLSFDKWMELDMEYIKHWSVWLDLKILAETVRAVMMQKGAA